MPNDRDTRFQTAAKLLLERLLSEDARKCSAEEQQNRAAQSLYDFMLHVVRNVDYITLESGTTEDLIMNIPDMPTWPEYDEQLQQDIAEWKVFLQKMGFLPNR